MSPSSWGLSRAVSPALDHGRFSAAGAPAPVFSDTHSPSAGTRWHSVPGQAAQLLA